MKIYSIDTPEFREYGTVLEGYDLASFIEKLKKTETPEDGVIYIPSVAALEEESVTDLLQNNFYGGMPIQAGICNGRNHTLNCLEYHRDAEINICATDIILLLAKISELKEYHLDTSRVKAFLVPANTAVQIFATTLHYAPCSVRKDEQFQVSVVLPAGTNTDKPAITAVSEEDKLLFARNKWLIAHPESPEAKEGAFIGLDGENIKIW